MINLKKSLHGGKVATTVYTGLPLGLENLGKWEGIFQSGKSQEIFKTGKVQGKSHKILENLGEFQTNVIF